MECAEKCEPVKGTFVANDEKVILTIDGVSYTFKVSRMLEEHGIVEVETEEMFGHFHIRKFNILLFIRPKNKRIPIQIISYIIK